MPKSRTVRGDENKTALKIRTTNVIQKPQYRKNSGLGLNTVFKNAIKRILARRYS